MTEEQAMQDKLTRLGVLMREARSDLDYSVTEAAVRSSMSRSRWTEFEAGRSSSPRPQTLRGIERCLDWAPHSIQMFLDGGPEPARQQIMDVSIPENRERLLAAIRRELTLDEQGELRRRLLEAIVESDRH